MKPPTRTRCYYEVLELTRTCSEEEIRKSFRRLALVWHPGEWDYDEGTPSPLLFLLRYNRTHLSFPPYLR